MVFVPPHDRVFEHSTSNSQTVFTVTGAVDTSYNPFSASMSIGDTTIGGVVEPNVAFKSGTLTYSNTNEITVSNVIESKGTFSSSGVKQVFMGLPAKSLGPIFSFEGDSYTDVANTGIWPTLLAANFAFFNRGLIKNFATGGDTAASMVGEYASQAGAVPIAKGQEAYFFLFAGRNDINALTSAATIYGYLTTIWSAARASGYKVVAFTIMPGIETGSTNPIRVALNALIRSDATPYDYLVDADLYFADPNEPSLRNLTFGGGGHLSTAGNMLLAQRVAAKILGVETVPAQPVDTYDINMALNGAMDIDQRNAGAAVTGLTAGGNAYICDGYSVRTAGTSVVTAQQVSDAPPGFTKSLKVSVTTAEASLGASSFVWIRQAVEGYEVARLMPGASNSRPITVGFYVKAHRPANYSASIVNGVGTSGYPLLFAVNNADTWEFKTAIIPGDIAGAWAAAPNGGGLYFFIVMAAASTFQTTANVWGNGAAISATGTTNGVAATSDYMQTTAITILPAAHTLYAERMPRLFRPANKELVLCQRRFCSDFPLGTAPANNAQKHQMAAVSSATNTLVSQRIYFPASMRIAPAVTPFSSNAKASPTAGQWQYFSSGGAWTDGASSAAATVDTDGFTMGLTATVTNSGGWLVAGSWKAEADF